MMRKEIATANSKSRTQVETVKGVDADLAPSGFVCSILSGSSKDKFKPRFAFYLERRISAVPAPAGPIVQKFEFRGRAPCSPETERMAPQKRPFPQDWEKCTKLHPNVL